MLSFLLAIGVILNVEGMPLRYLKIQLENYEDL